MKRIFINCLIIIILSSVKMFSQVCSQLKLYYDSTDHYSYFTEDINAPFPDTILDGHFGDIIDYRCIRDTVVILSRGGYFMYYIYFQNENGDWDQNFLTGSGPLMKSNIAWGVDRITDEIYFIHPPEEWGIEDIHKVWYIRDGEKRYIDFDARIEETRQFLREGRQYLRETQLQNSDDE